MNIYLAGCEGAEAKYPRLKKYTAPHRLVSFFYLNDKTRDLYKDPEYNIMLDSGAFSAFTKGVKIRISDYIAFLKSAPSIKCYYNLDVIGNETRTWKNQEHLQKNGLKPLPVFHMGESFDSLKKCLEYEYFAFGGLVGTDSRTLCNYLDKMFRFIKGNSTRTHNKIHALGVTSDLVLRRYPWYSCDSTNWVQSSAMGNILAPKISRKGFDFSIINSIHYNRSFKTDKVIQPYIEFLKEQLNDEELDITDYSHRYLINAFFFRQYEKTFDKE